MTSGAQRLFVAVDPPPHVIDHLAAFSRRLHVARANARLSASERWHVTVTFIGAVADARVEQVRDALHAATTGPSAHAMRLRLAGGGSFRGRGGAVLWAGVTGDVERLTKLARAVGRELRQARFDLERRKYQPHITIARPGNRVPRDLLAEDVAALDAYQGPEWKVTDIHLVRSYLGPQPRHVRIASFPLPDA